MLTQYLDKDGREISPEYKPVFVQNENGEQDDVTIRHSARYVQCERKDIKGLIWVGHCEECEHFRGHIKFNGVNCAIKKQRNGNK